MKHYTAYLFDWDGTIGNSSDVWLEAMRVNLAVHGTEAPQHALVHAMGDWGDLVHAGFLPAAALPAFYADTQAHAIARLPQTPLYEGVKEVFGLLRSAGKRLGVVTAGDRIVIDAILQAHGLTEVFDVVVSGSDVTKHKPHPEGVLLALQQLDIQEPAQAVMFGDTDRDLHAASQAGVDNVLFHPPNAHAKLEHITKDISPMLVLQSWNDFTI